MQRIRAEAHRFAVAYHRALRKRRTIASELSEIPGVGERSARKLLRSALSESATMSSFSGV